MYQQEAFDYYVSHGPTFYAWVVSFGGKMKIATPVNAVNEIKELALKSVCE